MAVLDRDYRRMSSLPIYASEVAKAFKNQMKNDNISGAQSLITEEYANLVLDANNLNNLTDTIDDMQKFWADDKAKFTNWWMNMTRYSRGYNLINFPYNYHQIIGNVAVTVNDDSSVIMSATYINSAYVYTYRQLMSAGSYAFKCVTNGGRGVCVVEHPTDYNIPNVNYYDRGDGVSFTVDYDWYMTSILFVDAPSYDDTTFKPILYSSDVEGVVWKPNGEYDPTYLYQRGSIVKYNDKPFICFSDDVTGEFDSTKWLLMAPNSLGVDFIGEFDPTQSHSPNQLGWMTNGNVIEWVVATDESNYIVVGRTYPNIRYLTDDSEAQSREIYIIPDES